jgi:phosphate/sulfate permease
LSAIVKNDPAPKKPDATVDTEGLRAKYGVSVVIAGLIVVFLSFLAAVIAYSEKASEVATAIGPVTGVVGTIVGAYFGVQVGASGKKDAEDARVTADHQAKQLAVVAPKEEGAQILGIDLSNLPGSGPQATPVQ